jgi:hypothetical protein
LQSLYYASIFCEYLDGHTACKGSPKLLDHRKVPFLINAEVVFLNTCEKCYFEEEAG